MTPNPKAQRWNEVSDGRRTDFASIDVDLSTARTDYEIDFTDGGFLYIDKSSNGNASIKLNSKNNVALYMGPGSSVQADYTKLYLSNTAQAGKKMRLIFSVDGRIAPGVDISTLDQIVQPVTISAINSPLVGQTLSTGIFGQIVDTTVHELIAPASNTNGIRIDSIYLGSDQVARLMANPTLPASWSASNVLGLAMIYAAGSDFNVPAVENKIIPAGHGVYVAQNAAGNTYFDICYEIL